MNYKFYLIIILSFLITGFVQACNLTDLELVALEDLESLDDAGNAAENYRNGIPLTSDEQKYFAYSFKKAIKKKLKIAGEESAACKATGLCQARSQAMWDVLEEGKNIRDSIESAETLKFKGQVTGRRTSEAIIFNTIKNYEVFLNGIPLGASTRRVIEGFGETWFIRRTFNEVKAGLYKLIYTEDWERLFTYQSAKLDAESLRSLVLDLDENQGALVVFEEIKRGGSTEELVRLDSNHVVLVYKKEGHVFLVDIYKSEGYADVDHIAIKKITDKPESFEPFVSQNYRKYISELQEEFNYYKEELEELEEGVSNPATEAELREINRVINQRELVRTQLSDYGFKNPTDPYHSVIGNYGFITRKGI